ncbi:MAG: hypothetical protein HUJ69_01150 [Lachnospiraceae bacterium]|nr:hypothetical protein [Lachnospiraceae bacterium]
MDIIYVKRRRETHMSLTGMEKGQILNLAGEIIDMMLEKVAAKVSEAFPLQELSKERLILLVEQLQRKNAALEEQLKLLDANQAESEGM